MNTTMRVALVTGAASGIGRSITESLLENGYIVGALDQNRDGIPEGAIPLIADVRETASITLAVDKFSQGQGRLDLLVNNAGISFVGGIEAGSENDWHNVLDINVLGQMRVLRAALPWLRKSDSASIVALSSCTATNGIPERALYSASKAAVQAMMLSMATDMLHENIRVNCIAPATVDTPFMTELANRSDDPIAKRREFEVRQPTGRMIHPDEVASAVLYLANPVNRSVTGTTLILDGGMGSLRPTIPLEATKK